MTDNIPRSRACERCGRDCIDPCEAFKILEEYIRSLETFFKSDGAIQAQKIAERVVSGMHSKEIQTPKTNVIK